MPNNKNNKIKQSVSNTKDLSAGVYIGAGLLASGFIVLSRVDRMALNPAGFIAPVLFITGWIIISIALWGRKNG